jgi:hypothetical protein
MGTEQELCVPGCLAVACETQKPVPCEIAEWVPHSLTASRMTRTTPPDRLITRPPFGTFQVVLRAVAQIVSALACVAIAVAAVSAAAATHLFLCTNTMSPVLSALLRST